MLRYSIPREIAPPFAAATCAELLHPPGLVLCAERGVLFPDDKRSIRWKHHYKRSQDRGKMETLAASVGARVGPVVGELVRDDEAGG